MNNSRLASEEEFDSFSFKNFLILCLGYWKWFLVSLVFFVGVGIFFIYTRQPVYQRSEEILVKDQEAGASISDGSNPFSQMGLFSNSTKVYNELIAFTSPAVMFEVVQRLDLTLNLTRRDGLKRQTLYGTNAPVLIEFPDLSDRDNIGFRMTLTPDGQYTISKVWKLVPGKKIKYDAELTGKVDGAPVKTPVGKVLVKSNVNYVEGSLPGDESHEIDVFKQGYLSAVEKYVAKLKGDLTDQDADVIKLSIEDTSVERANDILNMVVLVYNERWMEDNNKITRATSKFITERLADIEKELGTVDDKIADQKSTMRVPDIEEAAKGAIAQDYMIREERRKATNMLAMSTYLKEYLQNPANTYSILPMNTGSENMIVEEQIAAYNEVLLRRNNLAENSSEANPYVNDLDKQLAGLRNSIIRSVDSYIINLQNAINNIDREQAAASGELTTAPQQAKTLLSVERQQQVMQELYLFLLQKREENELTQSFIADNTRIITPPYGKQKPIAPKKSLWLIISAFFGLGIPALALFIAESANTKVRSKKDMENLPVPFAGEIPHIGKKKNILKIFQTKKKKRKEIDKPRIVVVEGKRDVPNEAFRVVRSNIDFMLGSNEHSVLAFTSFNPGSGKSFITFNLGASFALKGKKVLIIDGDLRHGSISLYVDSPRKGLSTYLTGKSDDWSSLVVKDSGVKGLNVLPIGHRPPNPAELLDNGRLPKLIEEARGEYDLILIDCPPVNIVVDTQIINQYVTRTIFVVRAGLLEKQGLRDLVNLVDEKKLKNITVLLNGTKTEFSTYHTYGNYEAIDKD